MKKLLLITALLLPSAAMADSAAKLRVAKYRNGSSMNLLSGVALNASAGTRTITLETDGFSKVRVLVNYTYAAATTVTAQFTCSLDGTTYGRLTSRATSSGAATVSAVTETYTTSAASAILVYEYDVRGCAKVQVLYGGASAGASDLVTVQAVAITGG